MLLEHGTFHYIHTNGTRFPAPVRRAPGRVHVICSVDAGLPATYVRLKRKDYLERVWGVLEQYVRAGVRVSLKYIVKEENCGGDDLEAFIDRAVGIGAHELILDIDYDFPVPGPAIIAALGRLKAMAHAARLHARFGFTGANFAPEHDIAGRVEAAFRAESRRRRGSLLTRLVRRARRVMLGWLTRRAVPATGRVPRVSGPASETGTCPDAAAKTGPDQPGGVGRRVWHLPVADGDADLGD